MFLAAMGIDIRGLGSSISLRKVLSWPSPAHTVPLFRLKPGAGIMNSWQACCPTPSPVADISNQWPHSFLLNLEADFRILSFHYSKQPAPLFGTAQVKTSFPVEWQSLVAENKGSGERQMRFSCHICHYQLCHPDCVRFSEAQLPHP